MPQKSRSHRQKKTRVARRPSRRSTARTQARSPRKKVLKAQPVSVAATVQPVTPMPVKTRSLQHLWMHFIVAGSAVAVLVLLGVIQSGIFSTRQSAAEDDRVAAIAFDHEGRTSVDILFARKGDAGYASIANRSPSALSVSLPSEWKRTEVNGASLDDVTGSIPSFGFRTWQLPPGAGMKMLLPESPDSVLLQNRGDDLAAVTLQAVDLIQETRTSTTILLQDEPSLVPLWGE